MPQPFSPDPLNGFPFFYAAVSVPFGILGTIEESEFIAHLQWLQKHHVRGILINGTTGEFFSLTVPERRRILQIARANYEGKIIQHVGGLSTSDAAEEARHSADAGADAIMALPPIYPAGLGTEGIALYLREIGNSTALPYFLYNFPKHTGNELTPEILSEVPHTAVKDSGKNLDLIPSSSAYLIGGDRDILRAMAKGARGFVSATCTALPHYYVELEQALAARNNESAEGIQGMIQRQQETMGGANSIAKIKWALHRQLDSYHPHTRAPIEELSAGESQKVDSYLENRGLLRAT